MKNIIRCLLFLCLLIVTLSFNACKKEGPQGPPGKVNIVTRTFVATSWSWQKPYYYIQLSVPEITSENHNTSAILVYFRGAGSTSWAALPFTQYDSPYNYYMGFITAVGLVEVTWVYDSSLSSGDDPNEYYGVDIEYKVVVIPSTQQLANPDVDYNNYEQVKMRFDLAE